MSNKHIADAETTFRVVNISPDFCIVGGKVVPFDIFQTLEPERSSYATTVNARKAKVLKVDSVVRGVIGNAGKGIASGVSQGTGHTIIEEGAKTVRVEGKLCVRHLDKCSMNVAK